MTRSCDGCVQKLPDWIHLAQNTVPYMTGNVLISERPFRFSRTLFHGGSSLVYTVHISGGYSEQGNVFRANWFTRLILAILECNIMYTKSITNVPVMFNFIFQ